MVNEVKAVETDMSHCILCEKSVNKKSQSGFGGILTPKGNICYKCCFTIGIMMNREVGHFDKPSEGYWLSEKTVKGGQVTDKQIKKFYKEKIVVDM
jgi:hypothetical protein